MFLEPRIRQQIIKQKLKSNSKTIHYTEYKNNHTQMKKQKNEKVKRV